ncbi:hypothetical protein ACJ41O_008120 [Fusarium nematophilum]
MVRTSTPDSIGDSGETGVIAIGMAIGSPTQAGEHPPTTWNPQRGINAASETPEPTPEPLEDKQQKARKWGLFRSKSKRTVRPPEPQRAMTDISNVSTTSLSSGVPSTSGVPTMSAAQADQSSRRAPKHKPIVIRSQTEPVIEESRVEVPMPTDMKPISPGKLTKEKPAIERKPSKESSSGGIGRKMSLRALRGDSARKRAEKAAAAAVPVPSPPPVPQMPKLDSPLLDIEIPSIKMERYSVMFNGVLQPQGSASSLLARRQATLDRLKTISDAIAGEVQDSRPRRATSPQPKASPTFVGAEIPKPLPSSQLLRSNTSPALFRSPVQASFHDEAHPHEGSRARLVQVSRIQDSHQGKKPQLVSKFSKRSAVSPLEKRNLTPSRQVSAPGPGLSPTARSNHPSPFTPDTSSLVLDSPMTDDDAEIHIIKGKLQPAPSEEPAWQMISPPASTASSSPENSRKLSPPSSLASPDKITVTKLPDPDPEEALRNAVEISIARQISVSHQQRKMLHPLKSNPSVGRRNDGSPGGPAGTYIPVGKNERLVETKTATPTVVHPRELLHSPDAFQMHRKSERVILEGP